MDLNGVSFERDFLREYPIDRVETTTRAEKLQLWYDGIVFGSVVGFAAGASLTLISLVWWWK